MRALLDGNPDYRKVTIIRVDWDTHRNGPLVAHLRVPRRSTLVMFKDGQEIGRVVAQTGRVPIEGLFRAAM